MAKRFERQAGTITYIEPFPVKDTRGVTEFCFDHTTQQRVTPKAAPRAGSFGKRTMNSGGRAAGYIPPDKL